VTLIVGIQCQNGVVLAADSEVTMGSAGVGVTAALRTAHKLTIQGKIIIGASGFVGLVQRMAPVLEKACENSINKKPDVIQKAVRDALVDIVKPEVEMAAAVARATGNGDVMQYALPCVLIAAAVNQQPRLLRVYETCGNEYVTPEIPFVAIGSGQKYAEPFLAFIRRALWPQEGLPTVADAEFYAYWTLDHVIKTHAQGGIGGKIELFTLTKEGNEWKAAPLDDGRLEHHENAVESAIDALRVWRAQFGVTPTAPSPKAPPV
jgi:ATP-dependent protease HslVU (ClpYQ) peptidase subunit